jgi:hypothetical protein
MHRRAWPESAYIVHGRWFGPLRQHRRDSGEPCVTCTRVALYQAVGLVGAVVAVLLVLVFR